MSQMFPSALAAQSTNAALARGSFWFGLTCLAGSFAGIGSIALARPGFTAWAVFPALVVLALGGLVLFLMPAARPALVVAVVLIEAVGIAWYVSTVFTYQNSVPSDPSANSDTLFISLATTAMLMFGVTAGRLLPNITSVVVAFVLAEGTVAILAFATRHPIVVDVSATGLFAVLVLTMILLRLSRARSRSAEPLIALANEVDAAASERERADSRVSALVHDTVLNELAVVSTRPPGEVPQNVRDRIGASLARVIGEDAQGGDALVAGESLQGALAAAVDSARAAGLAVTVEGDLDAASALSARVASELGLAIGQCLGNVLSHSGVDAAELAVIAGDGILTVMVIDSGSGFVEQSVGGDRLGLRQSIRGRIEGVGGSVQVWTTPGVGTSVSLTVPL